jgi:two-component system, NarL family, response regulator DegU
MTANRGADVFLLAENRLLREALVRLLAKKSDIQVVGANPYSQAVHDEIVAARPNIIVLDSNGMASSVISNLQESIPGARIVMVDMDSDENTFLKAVREGVVGYVLKDASAVELAAAIRAVACGEAVCPPSLTVALFRTASRQGSAAFTSSLGTELGLSRREQQLVELLRQRLTNKEIASQLNLSEQTVKNHIHNILRKVGASDRSSAVERCEVERFRSSAGIRE